MICIFTGEDFRQCCCPVCARRRDAQSLEHGRSSAVPARPFVHRRRRPCPTGIPGSLDGVVPYQPSRCAVQCTCCAWCRGEEKPDDPKGCTCRRPLPAIEWSNCERDHSTLVQCRDGCKPRPIAAAVVVQQPGLLERFLRWLFGRRSR